MAAGAMLGASAISAKGALEAGQMTSDSLNAQADSLEAQAQEAEAKGRFDSNRQQLMAGQKIGESTAAYGASGVTSTSGSVMDVIQALHMNAELDRLNILHNADVRAVNYHNQASMDRFGGQSALFGSYWQALSNISGGAIKAASFSAGPSGGSGGGEAAASDVGAGNYTGGDSAGEAAALA